VTFAIRLEFDGDSGRGDEPIRGRLVGSDGRSQPFDGWLRLLAELENAVRSRSVAPAAGRERDRYSGGS
jgi:hypothetical protein